MRVLSVTTMRDEGPFILEWLAWHRVIGVTDFLIYTNDCADGTDRLLDALAAQGVVDHRPNPVKSDKSVQWSGLRAAWQDDLRKKADWMLVSDVDEFPVIHTGAHRLQDLFDAIPDTAEAITLPWRLFGSNNVVDLVDKPVTAQFLRSAPPDLLSPISATFFKSLFRPAAFARPGVHRPRHKKDHTPQWIGGSGQVLPPVIAANDTRLSLMGSHRARNMVELHHYSLRSALSFLVKTQRGLPNRADKPIDLAYWVTRNFNTVENHAALALQDALQREMQSLMALPGIAEAHRHCFDWHQSRIAALLRAPESYQLFTQILMARDSAALPEAMAQRLLVLFSRLDRADGASEAS